MAALLNKEEATALTEQVRRNTNETARLIKKAWEGKIWLPLNYTSFSEWLSGEFHWSHTRGYQLLNIATMDKHLHELLPLPADWEISDRETRIIISAGTDDFFKELEIKTTEIPADNLTLLQEQVEAATPPPPVNTDNRGSVIPLGIIQTPRKVEGGERNARTGMSSVHSFSVQATALPHPDGLSRETLQFVIPQLTTAITQAETRLTEYETAFQRIHISSKETS